MLKLLALAMAVAGDVPDAVPWSRIRSLQDGLVREVRVWRTSEGEALVEVLHDGRRIESNVIEMEVPLTPAQILLRERDMVDLQCVRAISPGWRASRVRSWAPAPDSILTDDALERALPGWTGGTAMIWYFDDLIVIARVMDGTVMEMHEVFEPGTVELRNEADRARRDLDRSLQRIRSRSRRNEQ